MQQFTAFMIGIFVYILVFFFLQWALFNTRRVKQLIYTFSGLAFLSAFLVWIPFYCLTGELYLDDVTRGLLAFGGAYGSLGFSGTYIILGPISADRSLSAHMCIQVMRNGGRIKEAELRRRYSQDVIFNKRFDEYVDVGVMTRDGEDLVLSPKGYRVARIFSTFLKALKMKENF